MAGSLSDVTGPAGDARGHKRDSYPVLPLAVITGAAGTRDDAFLKVSLMTLLQMRTRQRRGDDAGPAAMWVIGCGVNGTDGEQHERDGQEKNTATRSDTRLRRSACRK